MKNNDKQTGTFEMTSLLTCPYGDLVLPTDNMMKRSAEMKQHFLEYHDRNQLADMVTTLLIDKDKQIPKSSLLCDECNQIITKEDDYGGTYVHDHDEDFHYECFQERARKHVAEWVGPPQGLLDNWKWVKDPPNEIPYTEKPPHCWFCRGEIKGWALAHLMKHGELDMTVCLSCCAAIATMFSLKDDKVK